MNGISPWTAAASHTFAGDKMEIIYSKSFNDINFIVNATHDSLWVLAEWAGGGKIAFRMAYSPNGILNVKHTDGKNQEAIFHLDTVIGDYYIKVVFPENEGSALKYTTTLKPHTDLLIPFWPRDIVVPGSNGKPENTAGNIHVSQVGTRSGLIYFSITRPRAGSVLYMQNLTALADYCQQTETSCAETVGGRWPELGFALPPTKEKPLAAGKKVTLSDALVVLSREVPDDERGVIKQYLDLMADAYVELPKPETQYHNWPVILDKGLKDLIESPGCWSYVNGHAYFNAYVSDYVTPPEIMVQLAVLLPLLDYVEWSGASLDVMKVIKEGLPAFYDKKLKTIMRWLPAAENKLDGEEEQKKPKVMDSWYLQHPLLNLSRMALKGDSLAKQLFLDSIGYAIKVARHFKYQWPVFYHMETLETVKAETEPGKGGEKDVAGIYAHVMLQAYELTNDKKYLSEAEKAAQTLQGLGFEMFYQANNTAFGAGAMLRLFKITKNKLYLELSYLALANVFKNVRLWDCNYGYGKYFPSFFCLFPLSNAPYTAVYEEQEVFCAFHDYLKHAEGVEILPSISLLLSEFIRYMVSRAVYYYPPMLPKEMLSDEVKVGEVDPKLWIALEDMHDGWEKNGGVGQEVYGAGNAFGILPRHYFKVPGESFMVCIDYPVAGFKCRNNKITFNTKGDSRLTCRLIMVAADKKKLPIFTVRLKEHKEQIKGNRMKDGHTEFAITGNASVEVSW
ncbi:hypothetical protein [Mucilaginibacter sp.]|uniref:hypothetical protein n=1 Tax=Mucilaginibacter sp. TaxID=1882438 RepID=UPI00262EFC69|nr:hypothetical protein [Mucilaginibacter sp.]MDB4921525.1 hypothetical protein [Mucilaginibacter sp.]